ncbi:hypothetical protein TrRE_jg11491, partial [Triparma retinervis]
GGGGGDTEVYDDVRGKDGEFVCPARRIFAPTQGSLVCTTTAPVCEEEVCRKVVDVVQGHVESVNKGIWGSVRAATVKTTDVAIEDVPVLRGWMRSLCEERLFPIVHERYPVLRDGSRTYVVGEGGERESRLRLHDAFIVRYDEGDGSLSLPEHVDTSVVSMTVALNGGGEYEGGGTWFQDLAEDGGGKGRRGRVLNNEVGGATIFAGPMRHAGFPIRKGTRWIAVLFCYEEGEKGEKGVRPSGDTDGGYVVYRQTVELANLLERNDYDEEGEGEEG